jgi:hypothetical protein
MLDTSVTSDTVAFVTDCNIRNIDQSLLRRMKARAAEEGLTLRDWSLRAFAEKLERHGSGSSESAEGKKRQRKPDAGRLDADDALPPKQGEAEVVAAPSEATCKHGYTACVMCGFGLPRK